MTISRRTFLKRTIAGAGLLVSGQFDLRALAKDEPMSSDLAKMIRGQIIKSGDAAYEEARKVYNGRISLHPNQVLMCEDEHDVSQAIKWIRENKTPFSVRGGGHSYEGFSVADGGTVIDVGKMNKIVVHPDKKTATVQTGVRLLDLYEALWENRLVVPSGSCATVGVAGVTLGGGFGLLARHLGLTCDSLIGLKIVDANGKVLSVDEKNHQDLLWASRGGGGGNFGVATEFTYRLHPIGNVSIFRAKWNWSEMPHIIKAWQDWAPHADERMTSVLTLASKKSKRLSCVGVFVGGQKQAQAVAQPLLNASTPIHFSMTNVPFMEAVHRFSGLKKEDPATKNKAPHAVHMQMHPRFKNTSDYAQDKLSDDAINTIVNFLADSPHDSSCVQFDSYGGAVNKVPIKDSAFCHRGDTKFCLHYQISWSRAEQDANSIRWINEFREAMQPHVSGFAYANYCDREIENWPHAYYGTNLERLISIKQKYDPENFFNFAQSIPTAVSS